MKKVTLVASIAVVAIGGIAGVLVGGAGAEIAREHDMPARARAQHGSAIVHRLPRMAAAQPEAQPETVSPAAGFNLEIVPQPSHLPASVRPRKLLAPTAIDFAPSASLHSMTRSVAYPEQMLTGSSSLVSLQPPQPVHTPARSASIVDRDHSAPVLRSERTPAATPARNAQQQTTTAALQPQPAVRAPAVPRTVTARTQPTPTPARERVTPRTEPVVHAPPASQPVSQPATQPGTGTVAATPLPAAGPAPDATRQTTMSQGGEGFASEPTPTPPPAPAQSAPPPAQQTAATQPQAEPSSALLANP